MTIQRLGVYASIVTSLLLVPTAVSADMKTSEPLLERPYRTVQARHQLVNVMQSESVPYTSIPVMYRPLHYQQTLVTTGTADTTPPLSFFPERLVETGGDPMPNPAWWPSWIGRPSNF